MLKPTLYRRYCYYFQTPLQQIQGTEQLLKSLRATGYSHSQHTKVEDIYLQQASLVAQMVKNPPVGDPGLIPGLGRSPGKGNGYLLQYSCLENFMDRGAWQAIVHGLAKSRTQLSDFNVNVNASPLAIILWPQFFLTSPYVHLSNKIKFCICCSLV